jgi:hypothetical protein
MPSTVWLDDLLDRDQIDHAVVGDVLEHLRHAGFRIRADLVGGMDFLFERGGHGIDALGFAFSAVGTFRSVASLGALLDIDDHTVAEGFELLDFLDGADTEALKQKRCAQPGPVQFDHEHAEFQLVDVDLDSADGHDFWIAAYIRSVTCGDAAVYVCGIAGGQLRVCEPRT